MGLNVSHDAWCGGYKSFNNWRRELAIAAGLPPLDLMEGFYKGLKTDNLGPPTLAHGYKVVYVNLVVLDEHLPIKWECLKPDPLYELLYHSDCDGEINWNRCWGIATRLTEILWIMPASWRSATGKFISGLGKASSLQQNLLFR